MRLAGAHRKKEESEVTYKQIVRASSNDHLMTSRQIEKDLLRTLPSNICFNTEKAVGIPRLRRILRGVAWLYPDIGYCQGMGMIVAIFLLLLEEEDSFWITCAVVEDLLPASYFSSSLVGVQVGATLATEAYWLILHSIRNMFSHLCRPTSSFSAVSSLRLYRRSTRSCKTTTSRSH